MSANINLLVQTDEESVRRRKRVRIFNLSAVASLVCVGLISLVIFLLIQAVNVAGIKREQEEILAKMSQFQDRQAKLFILNDRIQNIDKILSGRKDFAKTMSNLLTKIPANLSIDNFEFDDKSIIIAGQSKSLSSIGEFINNLTDMVRNKEVIKSLTLNSLTLDDGKKTYQVSVRSTLQ